ncbi:glycosyltransferase family 2 protein [Novosphingobium mathurense]|uniref:Glycosyltransferase involved in cell wall bisynthesis n=1 Tax=Novosphingobium mathurense TaxID=428990 RepID=A0A1U6IBT0_9SPHN|nr:glycosyltransferase family A protein [Novosphingobium mathurense]SLK05460.1 Glycosyltransferase involved in cell wall bisynthesis [Novosphingobium mathurense]
MSDISVIIPARDAEATLARTLDSLLVQEMHDWHAVIVNDGSSDATAAIAGRYCNSDPRFAMVEAGGLGLAAARNEGLRHARGRSLFFIDSDDWIAPDHLKWLSIGLAGDAAADASYCGYLRVTPRGKGFMPRFDPAIAADPVGTFAHRNPLAPHAVLLRRDPVESLGGFDTAFRTCEDWDMWQRLALAGSAFVPIRDLHARYRLRPGSLSTDLVQLFGDAQRVIARGCFEAGAAAEDASTGFAWFELWCAAVAAGQDRAWRNDLHDLPQIAVGPEYVATAARMILEAFCSGACRTPGELVPHWPQVSANLAHMLEGRIAAQSQRAVVDAIARMLGIVPGRDAELVSVVIPAYKADGLIAETLQSVQTQSHRALEIVVVDDGSPDSTAAQVLKVAAEDPRIALVQQDNAGVAAARNRGWQAAASDLIAFVDADDLWAPTKIERQRAALKAAGRRAGLAYTWYARIDGESCVTSLSHRPHAEGDVLHAIMHGNFVGNGSAALMTREALEHVGGFDSSLHERGAQGCEDLSIYFRIAEKFRFALVPEPLTGYRVMDGNMSSDMMRMLRSFDLVAAEMVARHPQYRKEIRTGRRFYLEWSLLAAAERGDFRSMLKLLPVFAAQAPFAALGVLLARVPRALVRGLRQRIAGRPRRRQGHGPVRFTIGSYEESYGQGS